MAGTKISEIKESSIKRVIKRISVCNYSHFFPLENSLDPTLSTVENQYKQTQKKKAIERGIKSPETAPRSSSAQAIPVGRDQSGSCQVAS